jgi:hypothetical protein
LLNSNGKANPAKWKRQHSRTGKSEKQKLKWLLCAKRFDNIGFDVVA